MQAKFVTVKEIADELGVSYITALNYIKRGYIRGVQIGGQWRVALEELERFKRDGNRPKEDAHAQESAPVQAN